MNYFCKIFLILGLITNAPLYSMNEKETQTATQLISPLSWLQELSHEHITLDSIQQAFNDTFSLICLAVAQQHNPLESKQWLESEIATIDTLIGQIHETTAQQYSELHGSLNEAQIEATKKADIYYFYIHRTLDSNVAQLKKNITKLISMLDGMITSGKTSPNPYDARFLQSQVEEETGWRGIIQRCTIS